MNKSSLVSGARGKRYAEQTDDEGVGWKIIVGFVRSVTSNCGQFFVISMALCAMPHNSHGDWRLSPARFGFLLTVAGNNLPQRFFTPRRL